MESVFIPSINGPLEVKGKQTFNNAGAPSVFIGTEQREGYDTVKNFNPGKYFTTKEGAVPGSTKLMDSRIKNLKKQIQDLEERIHALTA